MKIMILLLVLLLLFAGLNYRQLYSKWAIWSESKRLVGLAENAALEFENPAPLEDRFNGKLSADFWKFSIINGGGKVSNESAWHAASISFEDGLTIRHYPDAEFIHESANLGHRPAPEQYNNLTLIGARGFRPTPASDVVLKFSSRVSEGFYGTAGVVVQPAGTLREDGMFARPFDMFGLAMVGPESSMQGTNGALSYLALKWALVNVEALPVDMHAWHEYEIRLRWISSTQWLGILKVDEQIVSEMPMPAFGPLEVHVWSDNYLLSDQPQHWWQIAPTMDVKFQDGGEKEFSLGYLRVFAEDR